MKRPDFIITYEAGSLSEGEISGQQPQTLNGLPPDPVFGSTGPKGVPPDAWTYALAKLKLTVTDVNSGKPVWTARASEEIPYPRKALHDLRRKINDLMARTLKSFPPASEPE